MAGGGDGTPDDTNDNDDDNDRHTAARMESSVDVAAASDNLNSSRSTTRDDDNDHRGDGDDVAWAAALLPVVEATRVNAHQIRMFLDTYINQHPDFNIGDGTALSALLSSGDEDFAMSLRSNTSAHHAAQHRVNAIQRYRQYTAAVQAACRRAWTQFNTPAMTAAVALQVLLAAAVLSTAVLADPAIVASVTAVNGSAGNGASLVPATIAFLVSGLAAFAADVVFGVADAFNLSLPVLIIGAAASACVPVMAWTHVRAAVKRKLLTSLDPWQAVFLMAMGLHSMASFSNSFVVYDDRVTPALAVLLIALRALQALRFNTNVIPIVTAAVVCCAAIRLSHVMRVCREEQEECAPLFSAEWEVSFGPSNLAVLVVVAVHSLVWWWLKAHENLHGVAWVRYRLLFAPMVLCMGMEWASEFLLGQSRSQPDTPTSSFLSSSPSPSHLLTARVPWLFEPGVRVLWPRIVLAITTATVCWCLTRGSMTAIQDKRDNQGGREVWVHGLPSRSTAVVAVVGAAVVDAAMVLVEARFVLGLALMLAAAAAYLWLIAEEEFARVTAAQAQSTRQPKYKVAVDRLRRNAVLIPSTPEAPTDMPPPPSSSSSSSSPSPLTSPRAADVCVWFLLTVVYFYFTGHQATLPTVRWTSGLVGLTEVHMGISGAFVWTATFTSAIVFALCLPLLITAVQMAMPRSLLQATGRWSGVEGDYWLFTSQLKHTQRRFVAASHVFAGLSIVRLAGAMAAALVLRRHLMVWKIFAPRLMFESGATVTVLVFLLVGALIMARLAVFGRAATRQITRITKQQ
ncbi:hypothetical protein PTSG_05559 [Salpingoeca rosetta]|uniref:GPI ethanolamine phosphate transferase 2 C-terminal domain-containing protein n=1 Tax=Salpingoeca rosetta (strain ATCC 50818 / BSB-021) TaxID=946362 RepID=F2UBJ8_SALR5|nr:uncharacterized protein PTSG_05559 [Salpingoeca rosetta]EGD73864.1 hypothetical protein PTSG_05559 [Salpingoeca rosetta]|eukprot:XP_004993427.1 hypothetical protein PTSG_05559 [Salpingoeca rosetta]